MQSVQQTVVPSSWDPQLHRPVGPGATRPVPATRSERPLRRGRILRARRRRAALQPRAAAPPRAAAQSPRTAGPRRRNPTLLAPSGLSRVGSHPAHALCSADAALGTPEDRGSMVSLVGRALRVHATSGVFSFLSRNLFYSCPNKQS